MHDEAAIGKITKENPEQNPGKNPDKNGPEIG